MVWRAGLWEKLIKHGIQGRCFNVILGMYKSVKLCMSVNGKLSSLFECNMGVRQGENLSPILFALFLNDLESFMNNSTLQRISLTECNSQNDTTVYLKLLLLLYADDTIIFEKTKVMIFENTKSISIMSLSMMETQLKWLTHLSTLEYTLTQRVLFLRPRFTCLKKLQKLCFHY